MKKMYIDQIHTGLNTLALSMDAQWFGMNRKDATEAQRNACEGLYQGYIAAICMMGGDWERGPATRTSPVNSLPASPLMLLLSKMR